MNRHIVRIAGDDGLVQDYEFGEPDDLLEGEMDVLLHELIWRAVDPDGEEERG